MHVRALDVCGEGSEGETAICAIPHALETYEARLAKSQIHADAKAHAIVRQRCSRDDTRRAGDSARLALQALANRLHDLPSSCLTIWLRL
jgi:hypothetical protein